MSGNRNMKLREKERDGLNTPYGKGLRTRALFAVSFALIGMGTFFASLTKMLGQVATEPLTQLLFDFTNDPYGALFFVIGLLGIFILSLALIFHWVKGSPKALTGGYIFLALIALIGLLIAAGVTTGPSSITPAPSSATLSSYLISYNAAGKGCSLSAQNTIDTCTVVWNYTSNSLFVAPSNGSATGSSGACAGTCNNFIAIGVHSARTDITNATYGFSYAVATLPTTNTLYNPASTYSPIVGYVAATGTAAGYWKLNWGSGSSAGLNPTNAAPSSTSSLTPSIVGIGAFGSATNILHIALPGTNSTYAPSWGTGVQGSSLIGMTIYSTYTLTFTVGNSNPSTFTLIVNLIGFHA